MTRELVLRAQRADHAAFEELAAAVTSRLHGTAILILRDADLARDAVQDTLIEAWRSLPVLRDPEAFEGWIYRILVRTCHQHGRRRGRQREVHDISEELPTPSGETAVDDRDQLERAFRRLSTEHRTVLVLHHHLGLPVAEAAHVLGVPPGTIKSRLSRATAAMRAALDADGRPTAGRLEVTA